ncbi:MAG: sigma-70 family RNA polymerase sigma factor [Polyangiaceae bacterium]
MDLDVEADAIAGGDATAFARFLVRAEPALRLSLRPFAARVDVEAVVQEACLRLWQVAPRFTRDGRDNGLLRLLVRIGKNLAIDELRRRREEVGREADAREDDVAGLVAAEDVDPFLRKIVVDCLEKLPTQPRRALVARLESAGADEDDALAERCSMKPNTFLQNITRGRKLLVDCLGGRGVDVRLAGAEGVR